MFSIETKEDIEILKELTGMSHNQVINTLNNQVDKVIEINQESLKNNESLMNKNLELLSMIQVQQKQLESSFKRQEKLEKRLESLITADDCRTIISDLLEKKTNPITLQKKVVSKEKKAQDIEKREFPIGELMKKKYNKLIIHGNEIIHETTNGRTFLLSVSLLQFLALVEIYHYRKGTFLLKDSKRICKLFNINRNQFGRIYYNIKEGVFYETINSIDKTIRGTSFLVKDDYIYIVDNNKKINTGVNVRMFNQLLNIYVNSDQPYSTIYKLSLEYDKINPIHLLVILRKNIDVSKMINSTGV